MNPHQVARMLKVSLLTVIFSLDLVLKCHGIGKEKNDTSSSSTILLRMKSFIGLKETELLLMAHRYMKKKKYDKAIRAYNEAIDKNDTKASYYVLRGNCYVVKGDDKLASIDYEKAVTLAMESGMREALGVDDEGLFRIGINLYDNKKYEKSIWCFTELINKDPSQTKYYDSRRRLYDEIGEHDKCILDLKKLVELETDASLKRDYRVYLIRKFLDARRFEEALEETLSMNEIFKLADTCQEFNYTQERKLGIRCYTELLNRDPNNSKYYKDRGRIYMSDNDRDAAISDFKECVKFDPRDEDGWNKLFNAMISAKKSDNAIVEEMRTLDYDLILNLGIYFYHNRKYEYAILFFNEAIKRDHSDPSNYELRGKCYLDMNDTDMAIFDFKNALRKDPNKEYLRIRLRDLLFEAERYKEAIDVVTPMDHDKIVPLCDKLFDVNKYGEAVRCFSEALKKNPKSADSYEKRGLCYQILKKPEEVISDFQNAKSIRPLSVSQKLGLSEAFIDLRRYEEADEVLNDIDRSWTKTDAELQRLYRARETIAAARATQLRSMENPVLVNAAAR